MLEWRAGGTRRREDRLITEEPLELRLAWPGRAAHRFTVTMRTPGADFDLAAGLVVGEGVAHLRDHIATVAYCTDATLAPEEAYNVTTVTLGAPPHRDPDARSLAQSSACGVCGKESLSAVRLFGGRPVDAEMPVRAATLVSLPGRLRERQRLFDRTGAVHAAGLFDPGGTALAVREDVGRHNAVDKVVGAAVLGAAQVRDLSAAVLVTSARAGFEIVQKAVMARIPVVVCVGAASSMAVACAREYGVTLAGFARDDRLVVYADPGRLLD